MKEAIKQLRLDIDSLAQYATLVGVPHSGLFYAKAWAGKLLGEYGDNDSPYKDGKSTIADIEPTDSRVDLNDTKSTTFITIDKEVWDGIESVVQKIDLLRQVISNIADRVKLLADLPNTREAAICRTQIWVYLCEARFALGFKLEDIKAEHDKAV
jgi:hypothetical protein